MRYYSRDGWAEKDWALIEKAREGAYWAGKEIDALVGSGGGAFGPLEIDEVIQAMETSIKHLKDVRANYLDRQGN